jgi:predicted amidohydrolase
LRVDGGGALGFALKYALGADKAERQNRHVRVGNRVRLHPLFFPRRALFFLPEGPAMLRSLNAPSVRNLTVAAQSGKALILTHVPPCVPLPECEAPPMQLTSLLHKVSHALAIACALLMGASALRAASPAPAKRFKVAAVAFDPAWGDLDGNISRMVAGLEDVARQGVRLAVLPEQATIGYIFDDFAMVEPYLDTVPGKATAAISKVTRAHHMYVVVGIAERDVGTGLGYNTVALIGPAGYVGKYRKHGLNAQDQRWVSVGNLGFPVFDTELGRITMLICYDDTYWQYGRLALLHDVDIIAWASASDRVIPGTPADKAKGDRSTVANVQYLSAHSGAFVVAATRNGIEVNPLTKQRLSYNGGSSIAVDRIRIASAKRDLCALLDRQVGRRLPIQNRAGVDADLRYDQRWPSANPIEPIKTYGSSGEEVSPFRFARASRKQLACVPIDRIAEAFLVRREVAFKH